MNATQQSPDPDPDDPKRNMIPARELVTNNQVSALLSIVNCLQPYLIHRYIISGTPEDDISPNHVQARAHSAAVSAFVRTCGTLENMLKQKRRWDTSTHDIVYKNARKIQEAHLELLQAQKEATAATKRPSRSLAIEIRVIEGGAIIAFFGDISKPGRAIIGQGRTPEEAMADFDRAFLLPASQQIIGELSPQPPVDKPNNLDETPPADENTL